jgi:hypothetical protein
MSRLMALTDNRLLYVGGKKRGLPDDPREILDILGISSRGRGLSVEALPFSLNDTTAGSENELQVAVEGTADNVDLPLTIKESNYFRNIIRRASSGVGPKKVISELERFLNDNPEQIWENSWVRLPREALSRSAYNLFISDLRSDKKNYHSPPRSDKGRFILHDSGREFLRIPVSYLLKLSLADSMASQGDIPRSVLSRAARLLNHFLNDNTSPETFSFHVVPVRREIGMGKAVAKETSKRFLLTQLLALYANDKFLLKENGQRVIVYFSSLPPVRQKKLNGIISDSFYRELFMNPCLSGWENGEEKHNYMHLCHQVLSRSQLNCIAKLRDADIIANNLAVLPNTSNISLANNGTHISLGSIILSDRLEDRSSGFTSEHEKYLGDLAIKMTEHFLPLFVGTYSAAPYRLDFADFRPEKALGFLPHELDYTHLRMIWRRWKRKAHLRFMGQTITPFGPIWLDNSIRKTLRLKGDFVPDFRLIDYLVALMSTDQCNALDGTLGNDVHLKKDLADLGIFDTKMSLYLLYKLREHHKMGFSGFEGRYYSLFSSIMEDMGNAVNLQNLLNALAFKYMARGSLSHSHIPNDPAIESERRQIFFCAAIGIPTFYVRSNTGNLFLKRIVEKTDNVRGSRRYPGYLRICVDDYRKALLKVLQEDAADLIEMLGLRETINDLAQRLEKPEECSVSGKLTKGILNKLNARSSMSLDADDFNVGAERYYREDLRKLYLAESFRILKEDLQGMNSNSPEYAKSVSAILGNENPLKFLDRMSDAAADETAPLDDVRRLIYMTIISIDYDSGQYERIMDKDSHVYNQTPVYRAKYEEDMYRAAL